MKKFILALMMICLLMSVHPVWGDATIETSISSGGIAGMGAAEVTHTQRYQGKKMFESTSSKFTGAILSKVMSGTEDITITRVDKGVYWDIDMKDQTYSERPIVPIQFKTAGREEAAKEGKSTSRVTKSEFNVKKTGMSETINGFKCEEYVMTWLIEIEDLETKSRSRFLMKNNLWNTPTTSAIGKLQAEQQSFNKALAKKIGMMSPTESKQMGMEALAAMANIPEAEMKKGLGRMQNELAKIKGYPIRTAVSWSTDGDKQKSSKTQKDDASSEETTDLTSGGVGGLFSKFAGKVMQKTVGDKAEGNKDGSFFSSTIEVKSINTDAVPAATFEIPKDFKKEGE